MPYPGEHFLTTFGGTLPGGEQWATSFRSTAGEGGGDVDDVGNLLAIEIARTTCPIAGTAKLVWAKHNRIGPDGKYVEQTTNLWEAATPITAGGGQTVTHPNQIALVMTLETDVSRGLANKGRMYLPVPKFKAGPLDGIITTAEAASACTWVSGLLVAFANLPGTGLPTVFSDVREGAANRISNVTCGLVLDTMRSRRTQLAEKYVAGSPVPLP